MHKTGDTKGLCVLRYNT